MRVLAASVPLVFHSEVMDIDVDMDVVMDVDMDTSMALGVMAAMAIMNTDAMVITVVIVATMGIDHCEKLTHTMN